MTSATENGVKYRLGIDLGTNSIGWAAIQLDEKGDPCGTLDMGVRIFPDGRKPRDETSNAVQRRLARGQRRRRSRYVKRRENAIEALVSFGLMPTDKDKRDSIGSDAKRFDPYEMRAKALDGPLEPFQLGRALFHLNQRRGFKSNRKAAVADGSDEKEARAAISELRRLIAQSGARTLGEYLNRRRRRGEAVRAKAETGIYPDRAMYEKEFDKIREAQAPHQDLSDEQWDKLRETIFFQLPLKPVDPGWCLLEDGKPRAAKALPVFQEFRILQETNNLKLQVGAEPERALDTGERARALARLRSGMDINLKRPVKSLGFPMDAQFNLAHGARTVIKGDETSKLLSKKEMFGKKWLALGLDERNSISQFLIDTDPDVVHEKALREWGLSENQAEAVAHVSLPSGYGNLSEKAIRKLLPYLEKGFFYSEAVAMAGYRHHSDFRNEEARDKLPYYGQVLRRHVAGANPEKDAKVDGEPARYVRIANPTVHIGLGQIRRVVNKLIDAYGKPEEIVVELARDLKMNREQKQNYENRQKEGANRNHRLIEKLESAEVPITDRTLMKLRLWEEQGPVCPYSGRPLSFEMVVSAQTEIDHILPFSRTLDNSMNNKVVCTREANREKGDRTPYEAFGHNPTGYVYDEILERAAKLPYGKRWRFQPDAMEQFEGERGFLDRQLNETRYLSRTARLYLAHLYDERDGIKVRVVPGQMTALLRRGWGLNGMLRTPQECMEDKKQRDDHRHHAIDAFVVGNTTQGLLHQFAKAAGSDWTDAAGNLAKFAPKPWEGFQRDELKPFLDKLVVSHKPDHGTRGVKGKTTGRLHEETAYGLIDFVEGGASQVVVRKQLAKLKRSDLEPSRESPPRKGVRDVALRAALLKLWDAVEGKPAEFARRAAEEGVTLSGKRQRVKSVRVVDRKRVIPIKDGDGRPFKGYLSGGNEFAAVWRMRDGSWKTVAVPVFHANQPDFNIKNFRPRTTTRGKHKGKPDPAAKLLMRLHRDDMGALGTEENMRLVRVRKITNASAGVFIFLDDHNEANTAARTAKKELKEGKYSAKQLREHGFRKVIVDEIGRVVKGPGPYPS